MDAESIMDAPQNPLGPSDPTPKVEATWPFGAEAPVIRPVEPAVPTPAPVPAPEPARRRRWPIAAAAGVFFLGTVGSAAGVAYVVADRAADDTTNEVAQIVPAVATNDEATATPAGVATTTTVAPAVVESAVGGLSGEPFANAASIVAPAVVQINTGSGVGSGVIYDQSGLILTAAHVIDGSDDVTIRLADGNVIAGEVVGSHDLSDIGVVRVDTDLILPTATLSDGDDTTVGQLAVAVGSPFGLSQTVTAGIVSATDRILANGPNNVPMVQTDAAINPGNSGGPLVNLSGEVIGINSQIFTESGDNAGVGFAVSIDLAQLVADQLVAGDDVRLALLGVSTSATEDGTPGAQVQQVVEGSAAEAGGLEVGDVVLAIDGDAVRGSSDLRAEVLVREPGSTSTLLVVRDGQQLEISVTFGSTG